MRSNLQALVEHYLLEWDSSGWAQAYHSLIELGPQVLPDLEERLAEAENARFRAALVELARQLHSPEALRLFESALQDEAPEVWKAALDGLVDLASPAAVFVLDRALQAPAAGETDPAEWVSWVREAIDQAQAAYEARSGAA